MGNRGVDIGGIDWRTVARAEWPVPDGIDAARLADVLARMLAAADPVVRDEYGCTALTVWARRGILDSELARLGDAMARRLTAHPEIQARSFAALALRVVLTRGDDRCGDDVEGWYESFAQWYPNERDVRGHDPALGWLHAFAHGADAAAAFATALPERAPDILRLCARRMTARDTDIRYDQLEDASLARAITAVLCAPTLTRARALAWFEVLDDAFAGAEPGPCPAWAANTFATLQSLHLHLTRGLGDSGVPRHADAVAERVVGILRMPYPWLG
ncbi:DUF2785 domain-containing protein [Nocardia macrotermitis]|uniref:DUF2785 domain-containing protein n=1 Tax=Nocardia macrotermitis TaxID=2585198 RepID=UPI0012965B84|nr:DUF2785 domain-containing protein [Nocardia macrotermitis]